MHIADRSRPTTRNPAEEVRASPLRRKVPPKAVLAPKTRRFLLSLPSLGIRRKQCGCQCRTGIGRCSTEPLGFESASLWRRCPAEWDSVARHRGPRCRDRRNCRERGGCRRRTGTGRRSTDSPGQLSADREPRCPQKTPPPEPPWRPPPKPDQQTAPPEHRPHAISRPGS